MNYGKYVRGATRESLLEKAKKPLPWSDFVDMRKGNVYSLSKQEKVGRRQNENVKSFDIDL